MHKLSKQQMRRCLFTVIDHSYEFFLEDNSRIPSPKNLPDKKLQDDNLHHHTLLDDMLAYVMRVYQCMLYDGVPFWQAQR